MCYCWLQMKTGANSTKDNFSSQDWNNSRGNNLFISYHSVQCEKIPIKAAQLPNRDLSEFYVHPGGFPIVNLSSGSVVQCWNSRYDKARPTTDLFSIFVSYKGGVIFSICRTDKISDDRTTAMLKWYQPFYFSRVGYYVGNPVPVRPPSHVTCQTFSFLP